MAKTTKKRHKKPIKHPNTKANSFEHEEYVYKWMREKLRRISYQWPEIKEAQRKSRISRGNYKCAICEDIFKVKEISRDHKIPVISPEHGFQGLKEWLLTLFCLEDNIQVLCKECHDSKTFLENEIRKEAKEKKKLDNEDEMW